MGIGYAREGQFWTFSSSLGDAEHYMSIPHHLSLNLGEKKHFLEVGIGGSIITGPTSQNYLAYPLAGYRFHNENLKTSFRIFISWPFTGINTEDVLFVPLGISMGTLF